MVYMQSSEGFCTVYAESRMRHGPSGEDKGAGLNSAEGLAEGSRGAGYLSAAIGTFLERLGESGNHLPET